MFSGFSLKKGKGVVLDDFATVQEMKEPEGYLLLFVP